MCRVDGSVISLVVLGDIRANLVMLRGHQTIPTSAGRYQDYSIGLREPCDVGTKLRSLLMPSTLCSFLHLPFCVFIYLISLFFSFGGLHQAMLGGYSWLSAQGTLKPWGHIQHAKPGLIPLSCMSDPNINMTLSFIKERKQQRSPLEAIRKLF